MPTFGLLLGGKDVPDDAFLRKLHVEFCPQMATVAARATRDWLSPPVPVHEDIAGTGLCVQVMPNSLGLVTKQWPIRQGESMVFGENGVAMIGKHCLDWIRGEILHEVNRAPAVHAASSL